jgi:hypothetical protein
MTFQLGASSSLLAHPPPVPSCPSLLRAAVGDTDLVRISIMSYDSPESSGECLLAGRGSAGWQVHLLAVRRAPTCMRSAVQHNHTKGQQASSSG